ncbi:MarR family winged helix-turn-helix transcriptional regulator [Actinoplanes sp. NPDC020271]|uniref:MarR family winged helix-turn-helix transcriptional regulator n=1 Tax=Actinoplanes sp. NPDC020271 TaxID=3363896 RepID=UPI0037A38899
MSSDDSMTALVDELVRHAFQVTAVLTRIGAENDLSLTQLRVLGILRDRRPRVTELAGYLGLDKSTLSGLIDRAERRGLLGREKSPDDGRAVEVFLTPAGHELVELLYPEVHRVLVPALERLAGDERAQLLDLLVKLG